MPRDLFFVISKNVHRGAADMPTIVVEKEVLM
jgi:hypothetical protein